MLTACYKQEDNSVNYEDQHSTVIYNLAGDTLASDGWENTYETGDTYIRQHYYNATWTDSIRITPWGNEKINAALHVDGNTEAAITWLPAATTHPATPHENEAYSNTADNRDYIYRSGAWYQLSIEPYRKENDSLFINWVGYAKTPPASPVVDWAYGDSDNQRVYRYNGKAWVMMVNMANYRSNTKFIQVQYSRSGKESGKYNIFLYRFSDKKQQFIRDGADSARYLKTSDWDIAFTDNFNSIIWLNNAGYAKNPGYGSPLTKTSLVMYEYGYDFMSEAPADSVFDAVPASNMQIGFASEFGTGVNAWYEYSTTTHLAQPYPYRAYYLRLQEINPATGQSTYKYGKLQLISIYKGAPEVVTDYNWPSPYFTFRYYIQPDGSRNLKTKQ
ncbi:hypothetical protein SAMN05421788_109178 [Filimonas lacunae]|uniref:HmuY protein n=2 Tax=Filimonas lacunae TaxID=477680 RepID=A0A173MJ14_9BACT|nr:hypothetical protein FLA_3494 [Filimonas lacunae]SIT30256.1 hypothetical protein SAMN05421788_109178 [Filimonas lacunae]